MHFLVIEDFREGDARPVYARLATDGRRLPEGLTYVTSWVTNDLTRCYQVMECAERSVLEAWMAAWADLVHFEVVPVLTTEEARRAFVAPPS